MEKTKLAIILLFICFVINGCWEKIDSHDFEITNQSDNAIYGIISDSDIMFDYEKFLLLERLNKGQDLPEIDITNLFISEIIEPKKSMEIYRPMLWEDYINGSTDKKIRLFIIEKDSVDKYGWEYIHHHNVYNKKEILTLDDLKKIYWKFTYK